VLGLPITADDIKIFFIFINKFIKCIKIISERAM
jgi:hypothetical protein